VSDQPDPATPTGGVTQVADDTDDMVWVHEPYRVGKDPRDVIIAPVVTEKAYSLQEIGKYTFLVDPRANKTEVKIAIEKIFGVKVARNGVNILNRPGKARRTRNGTGRRKATKRAVVTVAEGSIDIFTGPAS
jgi:large subunit ribosomal protein L23